jgi:transketolase
MGDGELAEGSIWEAAMAGGHYGLDNLVGIIDRNGLQISGSTEKVMKQESLKERWNSFGWEVLEVDGHHMEELVSAFRSLPVVKGKPHLIVAHTIKGKGISFTENVAKWHHGVPSREQLEQAVKELEAQLKEVEAHE